MKVKRITHPELEPVEYYYCYFSSDKDLSDFAATCPWFNPEDISIYPAETCIIKHDTKLDYYQKLSPEYFKRVVAKKLDIYGAVLREAQNFF